VTRRDSALRWGATFLLGAHLGCAHATNYLDPAGPSYAGSPAPVRTAPPASIRVVTFNIEYGKRVELALAALRERPGLRNADLLALQEMDAPGVERMARELGFNYVYYPGALHSKTGRDVGDAVLSPWPILEHWVLRLPHRSRIVGQARVAVGTRLRMGETLVTFYSLHLGSPLGASNGQRRDQARMVLHDARGRPDPVIVAGDFNSHGLGKAFVAAGYRWPTEKVGPTTRSFSFDHVFVRGLEGWPTWAGTVLLNPPASDHRPVWVLLTKPEG
jgi:endonuclease/exonuclease/phosphatase family metal-dependent hydrolase